MAKAHHQVVIVGAGAAGITTAASLRRRAPGNLDIAIVEPSEKHLYQPALTLVGAGLMSLKQIERRVDSLIPSGVKRIRAAVSAFAPEQNTVTLSNGEALTYDWLIVCTGIQLDLDKVEGLAAALGKNGVCSNYSPEHAAYTWRCVRDLKPGAKALFTQPPLPFKCPGAPQKAAYLTADHLRRRGIVGDVHYYVHAPVIFGVPFFAKELLKVAARHGINTHFQHNLVAIDGAKKIATFEVVGGEGQGQRVSAPFDMLHVSPPQRPLACVRESLLANAAGWVDVNQNTLQHVRYPNVFSLGDVCSSPNSKTAAAVRKQAPVVVRNLLKAMAGAPVAPEYDGYASCPLTTAYGKAILAEFVFGGKVTPTLPLSPARERWVNWWIKLTGLPILYWHYMLRGFEAFPRHNTAFKEPS